LTGRTTGNGIRHALVVVNVALAFALDVATGLLVKSFRNLSALDPAVHQNLQDYSVPPNIMDLPTL